MKGRGVVYKAVKGEYEVDEFEPGKAWEGYFEVTSGEVPFIEDDGDLLMDDGKRGTIKITRVRMNTDIVEFRGVGCIKEENSSYFA